MPREKWLDAQNPKHVAISLNGEPTLYTRLAEYMDLCHKHGMTTMLVTNGTLPKVLEKLDTLPTQLYVSVDAPNKQVFDEVCRPKWNSGAWEQFEKTIDLLPSLDTRIVCRHTLMKGVNMSDAHIKEFAELDNRADPDFIENKGYVFVGHSRENLAMENMPSHDDIMDFSRKIAPLTNREVLSDSRPSRVALVGTEITPIPIPEPTMFFPEDLGIAPPVKHLPVISLTAPCWSDPPSCGEHSRRENGMDDVQHCFILFRRTHSEPNSIVRQHDAHVLGVPHKEPFRSAGFDEPKRGEARGWRQVGQQVVGHT